MVADGEPLEHAPGEPVGAPARTGVPQGPSPSRSARTCRRRRRSREPNSWASSPASSGTRCTTIAPASTTRNVWLRTGKPGSAAGRCCTGSRSPTRQPGALAAVRRGDDEHRVVEVADERVDLGATARASPAWCQAGASARQPDARGVVVPSRGKQAGDVGGVGARARWSTASSSYRPGPRAAGGAGASCGGAGRVVLYPLSAPIAGAIFRSNVVARA